MLVSGRVDTLYFGLSRYIKYQKILGKEIQNRDKEKESFHIVSQ